MLIVEGCRRERHDCGGRDSDGTASSSASVPAERVRTGDRATLNGEQA
jgi:hypothetical protein